MRIVAEFVIPASLVKQVEVDEAGRRVLVLKDGRRFFESEILASD